MENRKGQYRKLTEDEKEFIKSYAKGHSRIEITNALNERFQTDVPVYKVDCFLQDNSIATGYCSGHKYTQEEYEFLKEYVPGHSLKEISIAFNEKFGLHIKTTALERYMHRNNIHTGNTGYFKTNHKPTNKVPVGTERIRKTRKNKYIVVKVAEPDIWELKHLLVYKQAYGAVPEKKVVIFLDGNSLNPQLDNLMEVDKQIHLIMNRNNLPRNSKEETLASIQLAALMAAISDAKKKLHK